MSFSRPPCHQGDIRLMGEQWMQPCSVPPPPRSPTRWCHFWMIPQSFFIYLPLSDKTSTAKISIVRDLVKISLLMFFATKIFFTELIKTKNQIHVKVFANFRRIWLFSSGAQKLTFCENVGSLSYAECVYGLAFFLEFPIIRIIQPEILNYPYHPLKTNETIHEILVKIEHDIISRDVIFMFNARYLYFTTDRMRGQPTFYDV